MCEGSFPMRQNWPCPLCGYEPIPEFVQPAHGTQAGEVALISDGWRDIKEVVYSRHSKQGKPDSMKVMYFEDDVNYVSEYICLEHGGYASSKAKDWAKKMGHDTGEISVRDALDYSWLKPNRIKVSRDGKYDRVDKHEF